MQNITLGRTGLSAGRLGVSSSYGAPAKAFEEAFERGCNYFTWGTFIKGRSSNMKEAITNIARKGHRDDLIISMLTYAHNSFLTTLFLERGLKDLGVDYADVLLLGYYSKRPSQKVIDGALKLKEQGLVRFIGLTGHNRSLFQELQEEEFADIFHVRYSAAHRGAEQDTFPNLKKEARPGVVSFTATAWRKLLNPKKILKGEKVPSARDCYRFVLSNPDVDICMMGAKNMAQMIENLKVLEMNPMDEDEMEYMRRVGDHVYTGA